jgi:hypothetical protein
MSLKWSSLLLLSFLILIPTFIIGVVRMASRIVSEKVANFIIASGSQDLDLLLLDPFSLIPLERRGKLASVPQVLCRKS